MKNYTEETKTVINGILTDVRISFDYTPYEPCVTNPDSAGFGPGCDESFDITEFIIIDDDGDERDATFMVRFFEEELIEVLRELKDEPDEPDDYPHYLM